MMVEERIYEKLKEMVDEKEKSIKVGNKIDNEKVVGNMINKVNEKKVMEYIEIGRREGEKVEEGGEKLEGKGGG